MTWPCLLQGIHLKKENNFIGCSRGVRWSRFEWDDNTAWITACVKLNYRQSPVCWLDLHILSQSRSHKEMTFQTAPCRGDFLLDFHRVKKIARGCVALDVGQHPMRGAPAPPASAPAGLFLTAETRQDRQQPVQLSLGIAHNSHARNQLGPDVHIPHTNTHTHRPTPHLAPNPEFGLVITVPQVAFKWVGYRILWYRWMREAL